MEFLLNFLWLMLALPALWVWRRKSTSAHSPEFTCGLRSLALLGCVLILLFPVVSATDDLHAMRPELEEPGATSSLGKQLSGERAQSASCESGAFPGLLTFSSALIFTPSVTGQILSLVVLSTTTLTFSVVMGRAPPFSSI